MKNKGSLLLEFLIGIFIFSISMLLLLSFMKRIVLIQNYKSKINIINENSIYLFDLIKKNIKERDKENFLLGRKQKNIFIMNENEISNFGNSVFYKSEGDFIHMKFDKYKILVSRSETIDGFKKYDTLATLDSLSFHTENNILTITYEINKKIIRQVINLR